MLLFFCTLFFKSLLTENICDFLWTQSGFSLGVPSWRRIILSGNYRAPLRLKCGPENPPSEELVDICSYCNTRHRRKKPTLGFHLPTGFTAAPSMPHQPRSAGAADLPPDSLKRRNRPVMAPPYQFALLDVAHTFSLYLVTAIQHSAWQNK